MYLYTIFFCFSGSEFTVTNMDAEELRKSIRRSKKNLPPLSIHQPTSISGSQDSEDDEDEVSFFHFQLSEGYFIIIY